MAVDLGELALVVRFPLHPIHRIDLSRVRPPRPILVDTPGVGLTFRGITGGVPPLLAGRMIRMFQYAIAEFPAAAGAMAAAPAVAAAFDGARS
ncbi:hypothetical protein GCM10010193_24870 [Kitasatospora atroaurantiaca]|uniref:hypothetical protein n=1 Tax=Kitasatospora atroaurantiaca TaxID=285545 RepID=UPI0014785987|nr:hypothetical protein [Kitasatospora atroaurantiaca]